MKSIVDMQREFLDDSEGLHTDGEELSGSLNPSQSLPSTRVDRLLMERLRRNRSHQQMEDLVNTGGFGSFKDGMMESIKQDVDERLVVVANRLPVTCSRDAAGGWQLQVSAGGLVSALKGVSTYQTVWIGWPGIWVKPGRDRDALSMLLQQEGYIPVWIDPTLLDLYYNGFCNSVLWQLFHYVPLNIDSWQKMAEHRAMQMQWQAYQVANQKFADVVVEAHQQGDIVWVQDYHLMQLPMLLKNVIPKMKVGFFLHTPFPSSEIYRTLPVREDVLKAVLGADLIGFHTYDYARHFISSCTRILGLEGTPEGVENNGSITRVATFPIGIDPERFTRSLETDEVQSHIAKLLNRYAGRKIMLGVDRLDMVKGIPQKLLAYEKFLEEHPEWRDKVLLVQIAVPSRTDVPEYQKLRSMVHEIVGRINGQFGTLTYVPIYHLDTSLSFTELCALYAVTDVALVTSLRDGMNLVSYEYVACQSDNAGVLVLSEFAGAAQSLGAGAILVNPWNITDMAQAIEDALTMSEEERRERHRQNYMHVLTHTAQNWADNFISELNDTHIEADLRMRHAPPPLNIQEVVQCYLNSTRRLIVLGYNATLTTSVEAPRQAKRHFDHIKALAKVNPKVISSIQELCRDPNNTVVVFSGSETSKLEEIFAPLPVWLAAENGMYVRPPAFRGQTGRSTWVALFDTINREWMEAVQLVLDYFCERTPRSFVETRETSLVWNYKYADVEFGRIQARDLLQHLWTGPISNAPVEIIQGGRSVEVRPVGVTKGLAMQRLMGLMAETYGPEKATFEFILCLGHLLQRDENMFSLMEGHNIDGTTTNPINSYSRNPSDVRAHPAAVAQVPRVGALVGDNVLTPQSTLSAKLIKLQQMRYIKQQQRQQEQGLAGVGALRSSLEASEWDEPLEGVVFDESGTFEATVLQQHRSHEQQQQQPAAARSGASAGEVLSIAERRQLLHNQQQQQVDVSTSQLYASGNSAAAAALQGATESSSTPFGLPGNSPPGMIRTQIAGVEVSGGSAHLPSSVATERLIPAPPSTPVPLHQGLGSPQKQQQGQAHQQGLGQQQQQQQQQHSEGGSAAQGGVSTLVPPPGCFPPRFLFTCTVGRNRSKARYALGMASEVGDLLDSLVQQCIYHRLPQDMADASGLGAMESGPWSRGGRTESLSSTEAFSPEMMSAAVENWQQAILEDASMPGSRGVPQVPYTDWPRPPGGWGARAAQQPAGSSLAAAGGGEGEKAEGMWMSPRSWAAAAAAANPAAAAAVSGRSGPPNAEGTG